MALFVISDLHLSFGVPDKKMDKFGQQWESHPEKIRRHWEAMVDPDDLVLICGDISWAMRSEQATPDLEWIARLPGVKAMIRGNHDYWWSSLGKVQKICPPSLHPLQNNAFTYGDVTVGGSRLWDNEEVSFPELAGEGGMREERGNEALEEQRKIFNRECDRLEMSLKQLDPKAKTRIAMTHYPPVGLDLKPNRVTALLEDYRVDFCLFGHLHGVPSGKAPFGQARGVTYLLTSCDYLDFVPLRIL